MKYEKCVQNVGQKLKKLRLYPEDLVVDGMVILTFYIPCDTYVSFLLPKQLCAIYVYWSTYYSFFQLIAVFITRGSESPVKLSVLRNTSNGYKQWLAARYKMVIFHSECTHFNYHKSLFANVCLCGLNFNFSGKRMENMGIRLYNKVPTFSLLKENLKLFSCIMLFIQWMNVCLSYLM